MRGSYREIAGLSRPSGNVDVAAVLEMLGPRDPQIAREEYVAFIDAWCRREHDRERQLRIRSPAGS